MTTRINRRIARYVPPTDDECADMLDPDEFKFATTPRAARLRGRSKAWAHHRATGPYAQICGLSNGKLGDSIVLTLYTSSSQISYLIAKASREMRAKYSCKQERSLVDGEVYGLRVTLIGFADSQPSRMPSSPQEL
jgi:hypothetical protein